MINLPIDAIDPNQPMLLLAADSEITAVRQMLVYSEDDMTWYLMGFFDSAAVIEALPAGDEADVTVVSRFGWGQWVYGVDTVKVK